MPIKVLIKQMWLIGLSIDSIFKHAKCHVAVIAAILCCVSHQANAVDSVAIFVDGMSLSALGNTPFEKLTGPSPVRNSNYLLSESPLPSLLRPNISGQRQISWNGNLSDSQALRTAVNNLEALICQQRGNSIHIIAHSLGTVIAYTALAELAGVAGTDRPPACNNTEIASLVTLASPLGLDDTLPDKLGAVSGIKIPRLNQIVSARQLRIAGRWLNVYASGDPLGGKIDLPSVVNVSFSLDQSTLNPLKAHLFPYKDADAVRMIADVVIGVQTRLGAPDGPVAVTPPTASNTGTGDQAQVFNGDWLSEELGYGFRIQGSTGIAIQSNSPNFKVGEEILRFKATGANIFTGEQICTDGRFYSVTGTLRSDDTMGMTIKGCAPQNWTMRKKTKTESTASTQGGGASSTPADVSECKEAVARPGLSGWEAALALGPAKDHDRANAIISMVQGGTLRIPQCGGELGVALAGATEAHRARAIEAIVSVAKSGLSGEEGAAILGNAKECSEFDRANAITYLAGGKKFKQDLSGKELEMILDGTSGAHRARAIDAISNAHKK